MRKVQFEDQTLAEAFNRLVAFAECYRLGEVVHQPDGLTANDLDLLIARLAQTSGMVSIRYLDLSDPKDVAQVIAEAADAAAGL